MKHCKNTRHFLIAIYNQLGQRIRKVCCWGQNFAVSLTAFTLVSHLDLNLEQLIKKMRNQLTPIYPFWESANSISRIIFETRRKNRKKTLHKPQEKPKTMNKQAIYLREKEEEEEKKEKKKEKEEKMMMANMSKYANVCCDVETGPLWVTTKGELCLYLITTSTHKHWNWNWWKPKQLFQNDEIWGLSLIV